jgi:hypothetical protein
MKDRDLVRAMVGARVRFYRQITYVLLFCEVVCIMSLAGTIYLPTKTEPEVLTLLITFTSGLTGALITIITQGVQAARKMRSDEELQAELERISYQDVTGTQLPPGFFKQKEPEKEPPKV